MKQTIQSTQFSKFHLFPPKFSGPVPEKGERGKWKIDRKHPHPSNQTLLSPWEKRESKAKASRCMKIK
jgi:hypothetical protein